MVVYEYIDRLFWNLLYLFLIIILEIIDFEWNN